MTYTPEELDKLMRTIAAGTTQFYMPLAFADFLRATKKRVEQRKTQWLESRSQQHNDAVFMLDAFIEMLDDLLFELDDKHSGTQAETDLASPHGDDGDRDRSGHT